MRSLAWIVFVAATACSNSPSNGPDGGGDGGGGGDGSNTRAPAVHRAAGQTCPSQRGPGTLPPCDYDAGPPPVCLQDTDCTTGTNGRCLHPDLTPAQCIVACSYDECASDTDCPAGVPCTCRASATDVAANTCAGGSQCRVDSDCGPNGYCSPSAGYGAFGCGVAWFCHTASDGCVDDADCDAARCEYDETAKRWACGGPQCSPPP